MLVGTHARSVMRDIHVPGIAHASPWHLRAQPWPARVTRVYICRAQVGTMRELKLFSGLLKEEILQINLNLVQHVFTLPPPYPSSSMLMQACGGGGLGARAARKKFCQSGSRELFATLNFGGWGFLKTPCAVLLGCHVKRVDALFRTGKISFVTCRKMHVPNCNVRIRVGSSARVPLDCISRFARNLHPRSNLERCQPLLPVIASKCKRQTQPTNIDDKLDHDYT